MNNFVFCKIHRILCGYIYTCCLQNETKTVTTPTMPPCIRLVMYPSFRMTLRKKLGNTTVYSNCSILEQKNVLDKNNDALCCGIAENGATHVLRFFIGNEFTFSYNMEKLMNSKSYQNLMSRQTCPDFVGVGVVSRSKVQSLGIQVIGSYKFTQVFFYCYVKN